MKGPPDYGDGSRSMQLGQNLKPNKLTLASVGRLVLVIFIDMKRRSIEADDTSPMHTQEEGPGRYHHLV